MAMQCAKQLLHMKIDHMGNLGSKYGKVLEGAVSDNNSTFVPKQ